MRWVALCPPLCPCSVEDEVFTLCCTFSRRRPRFQYAAALRPPTVERPCSTLLDFHESRARRDSSRVSRDLHAELSTRPLPLQAVLTKRRHWREHLPVTLLADWHFLLMSSGVRNSIGVRISQCPRLTPHRQASANVTASVNASAASAASAGSLQRRLLLFWPVDNSKRTVTQARAEC